MKTITEHRLYLEQKKAIKKDLKQRILSTKKKVKQSKINVKNSTDALLILQHVAKQTQEQLEFHISELGSLALASVFNDPYKLRLIYETKRNKTEAGIWFEKNTELVEPLSEAGGGACDIAGFALRCACWSLEAKKKDNVLIMDEPLKNLSKSLIPKAALMLKEVSKKLGLQIIMVTHTEELMDIADKTFQVSIHKNKKFKQSKVEVINGKN